MSCRAGCTPLAEIVNRAAVLLQDADPVHGRHVRWHQSTLIDYVNEALCELSAHRPDAFSCVAKIRLEPGASQVLPSQYARLVRVESNAAVSQDGTVSSGPTVNEVDERISRIFRKKPCVSTPCDVGSAAYTVTSFTRNPFAPEYFTVDPPVPQGEAPEVTVTLIAKPKRLSATDMDSDLGLDCKYEPQVLDWVLMRARQTDTESQADLTAAELHKKAFYDALGIKYLQEQRFGSGYYGGVNTRVPEGDPNFRQR